VLTVIFGKNIIQGSVAACQSYAYMYTHIQLTTNSHGHMHLFIVNEWRLSVLKVEKTLRRTRTVSAIRAVCRLLQHVALCALYPDQQFALGETTRGARNAESNFQLSD